MIAVQRVIDRHANMHREVSEFAPVKRVTVRERVFPWFWRLFR